MIGDIFKNIGGIMIIGVFAVTAFFFIVLGGDPGKLPWSNGAVEEKNMDVVQKLQGHLANLGDVEINADLFASPEFKELDNFKMPLPELEVGKTNPFTSSAAPVRE